ncbi:MAG: 8-oxo-dGTP diphosphatase [Chlamydiae bacterium]|nr:8-oxo-dGTP diphosphatase [Chlamydiota bacterium]
MYNPIIGTLGYVLSPDHTSVLMVHRNKRNNDSHLGKFNGLGGKMHSDEDLLGCLKREIREEAGIECLDIILKGSINWTCFGPKEESWLGFIFLITAFSGDPYLENTEGSLSWIKIEEIPSLPLWEGDHYFLPLIFDKDPRPFYGYMPYKKEKVLSWQYSR